MTPIRKLAAGFMVAACMTATPALASLPGLDRGEGEEMPSLAPLVEEVSPTVVNIATRSTIEMEQHPLMQHPFFREFFEGRPGPRRQRETQSLGSGVIVDADQGYILTNHHVIADADQITVGLQDNREFEAEVIGSDPETDIAVIQIEADNLQEATLGNSEGLAPGDYVLAVGNPFGLDHTVTSGIVSGLGRSLSGQRTDARIQDFIQTDASINPGNSGGALINLRGEVVGINTAILSRSGGNIGIGFAVPVNMAETVMNQIIEHGDVRRGVLGVRIQDLTDDLADAMDIDPSTGVLVADVAEDSAASEAGLQQGDVITAVDGEPVRRPGALARVIGLKEPGTEVEISILRNGEERSLTAELQSRQTRSADAGKQPAGVLEGARFAELDDGSGRRPDLEGVLVAAVEPGSRAARYLEEGDVITSVNRQPVASLEAFRRAIQGQEQLLLRVHRDGRALFLVVK